MWSCLWAFMQNNSYQLFIISKTKELGCPWREEWMDGPWHAHTIEFHLYKAELNMLNENIMPREVS